MPSKTVPTDGPSIKSLWGELPDVSAIMAPVTILKQQGTLLARATKGLLTTSTNVEQISATLNPGPWQGQVAKLQVTMYLVATALNNYRFQVLSVIHGVELYPAVVKAEDQSISCPDQDGFEQAVEQIFQSDRVRTAIAGLLAQMRSN